MGGFSGSKRVAGSWLPAFRFQALITWSLIALIIFHFLLFAFFFFFCTTSTSARKPSTSCHLPCALRHIFIFIFNFHTFHFASFAWRISFSSSCCCYSLSSLHSLQLRPAIPKQFSVLPFYIFLQYPFQS